MSVAPLTSVTSKAVSLPIDNLDTDVITPIGRVMQGREATVRYAFEPLRFDAAGALRPDCPLNGPSAAGAQILLAGKNFGCGSSRETAVWAIAGLGYRVVIAESFGEIFFSNCFKNGVLAIAASRQQMTVLGVAAAAGDPVRVDLERQEIEAQSMRWPFDILPLRRESLLHGLDDLGLILRRAGAIDTFEATDRRERPWVYDIQET